MSEPTSRFAAFLAELRHRRVFRVAAVYACVAFIIFQIVDATFEPLRLPEWFSTAVVVLLLIGFPIAVGLAWAFDITEKGVVRAAKETAEAKAPRRVLIGNKTLAIVAAVAVAVAVWSWWGRPDKEAALGAKSIAVLPFANFSDSKDDEYFSDGVTDDIITHLTKIGDLKVISRTSVMLYKESKKPLRVIAEELGVSNILEGTVRRAGDKVRITSQLIDARTDEHLWAETYDRDLTDIFAIQSDVARNIAAALKAMLSPEERERIQQRPTESTAAYDHYLRAYEYERQGYERKAFEIAIDLYKKAIAIDPGFAQAYAHLARAHLFMYWDGGIIGGFYHTAERLAQAKSALDRALALYPDHLEVHLAQGYYYYHGFRDYMPALEHFYLALQDQPNDSDIIAAISNIQRRRGQWEAAAASMRKAAELDPRNYVIPLNLATTYLVMRNWAEAERFADRCIFTAPEQQSGYIQKARVYYSTGDVEKARGVMSKALEKVDPSRLAGTRSYIEILARDYQKALDILEADTADYFLRKANIYRYLGQPGSSRAYYDSARVTYEELVRNHPDDYAAHGNLGIAYAGLGRREEAIREGKLAVEILPLSRDATEGHYILNGLARIYTMLGEQDAAIDQLEVLLSVPNDITVPILNLDPRWDPLREHPRFRALLEKYGVS